MTEFNKFSKIARYSRTCIVTEKIDGTNAQIYIGDDGEFLTGSRNRWITPDNDNYGFSKWAHEHKDELVGLGSGRHYGEWWGSGIQRKYGLTDGDKRFSMFNAVRWCIAGNEPKRIATGDPRQVKMQDVLPPCVDLVPVLWEGNFDALDVEAVLGDLIETGSHARPWFLNPEGIVIHHIAAGVSFKKTIKGDSLPKSIKVGAA